MVLTQTSAALFVPGQALLAGNLVKVHPHHGAAADDAQEHALRNEKVLDCGAMVLEGDIFCDEIPANGAFLSLALVTEDTSDDDCCDVSTSAEAGHQPTTDTAWPEECTNAEENSLDSEQQVQDGVEL